MINQNRTWSRNLAMRNWGFRVVVVIVLVGFNLSINPVVGAPAESTATKDNASNALATISFELIDHRIFLPVRLNGTGPFYFILDSGGSSIVTSAVVRELGLTTYGTFNGVGVGENVVAAARCTVADVELGGLHFANQKVVTADLSEIKDAIGFRKFDGIIGYELFANFAVGIDFDRREVTLGQPDSFVFNPAVDVAVPMRLNKTIPVITAEVDGVASTFSIDTGDRWSLTLFGSFVQRHGLMAKYKPEPEIVTGWGVGGSVPAFVTQVSSLQVGGVDIKSPLTRFPILKKGAFARSDISGNIGNGILRRFNLVFEYAKKRLVLRKNADFDAPDTYDRSGMWLVQEGGHFKVSSLIKGGPAWQAGLRIGDSILAIDGRDASKLFLPAIRDQFSRPTVSRATVTTRVAGVRKTFVLQLRDLINDKSLASPRSSESG
jgi:hypothetical protein